MRTFKYEKIVRSRIPSLIEESGGSLEIRALTDAEAFTYLGEKVLEELVELQEATEEDRAEELADVLESSSALMTFSEVPLGDITELRQSEPRYNYSFTDLGNMATEVVAELQVIPIRERPAVLARLAGIVDALVRVSGIAPEHIEQIREDKLRRKGGFTPPVFVEVAHFPDTEMQWITYHQQHGYEEIR